MSYLCMGIVVYLLHLILKLNWIATGIALLSAVAFLLQLKKRQQAANLMQNRFQETCIYLEMMMNAFAREGKIEAALSDVLASVASGHLKDVLQQAYDHVSLTFDESEVMKDALQIIETEYDCKRVSALHQFMLHVEYFGGDRSAAIELMEKDEARWKRRIEEHQNDRHKDFREIVLSVAVSIIICGCIMYLPVMDIDISQKVITQVLSVVLIVLDELIMLRGMKYLNVDWIKLDSFWNENDTRKSMEDYRAFDARREGRRAMLYALPAIVATVALFALRHRWLGALGLGISFICLNSHRIGHRLKEKNLLKEIRSAFPVWLVDLVLLLQTENVQNAIQKSREQAPRVLSMDLERLEDELVMNPESSGPYHKFLKEFELPQVRTAMSMLYALSMGTAKDGGTQLMELVNSNFYLLDEAEKVRLKDKSSGMYLLFLAPVLTASFKLVVDMAMFMISFMGSSAVSF